MTFVDGTVDDNLLSPTLILSSVLSLHNSGGDPIEADIFTSGNGLSTGTAYQYLRFTAVGYEGLSSGLNEIRVFGEPAPAAAAVPEPGTISLMLGPLLLLGGTYRRWRHRLATPTTTSDPAVH